MTLLGRLRLGVILAVRFNLHVFPFYALLGTEGHIDTSYRGLGEHIAILLDATQ